MSANASLKHSCSRPENEVITSSASLFLTFRILRRWRLEGFEYHCPSDDSLINVSTLFSIASCRHTCPGNQDTTLDCSCDVELYARSRSALNIMRSVEPSMSSVPAAKSSSAVTQRLIDRHGRLPHGARSARRSSQQFHQLGYDFSLLRGITGGDRFLYTVRDVLPKNLLLDAPQRCTSS